MIFALAWRNIVRNLRRSLITVASVTIGLAALLFLWSFNDGVHNSMMRNLQEVIVGGVQIHARGFFHHPRLNRTVPDLTGVEQLLRRQGISRYALRLRTFALAAGEDSSAGLILLGVDPAREARITRLHEKVGKGRFLDQADRLACVMGATTARNLGLSIGDEVVMLAQDRFGALAADKFRLVGIIESGEMGIDRGLAVVPRKALNALLGMGGRVSGIVIQARRSDLESMTAHLRQALDPARFEVLRWYDMYPMMKQWVELENAFYYIFLSVVLFIVTAGVMNTVMMSMLERIREFGVMMALGCGRWRLAAVIAVESVILGVTGAAVGTCLGMSLVVFFNRYGIDLSSRMDTVSRFYIDPVIHTEIDPDHLLLTVAAVVIAPVFASLAPAFRAARLEPVEAIRHV